MSKDFDHIPVRPMTVEELRRVSGFVAGTCATVAGRIEPYRHTEAEGFVCRCGRALEWRDGWKHVGA